MMVWSIDPGAEIGAWIAALAGGYALLSQVWNALQKRKKEGAEIEKALDRTPAIKQQLELGNVGQAIEHLNEIIESQARAGERDQRRIQEEVAESARQRDRADLAENENERLEREVDEERRLRTAAEQDLAKVKRNFARTLTQLRQSQILSDDDTPDLT